MYTKTETVKSCLHSIGIAKRNCCTISNENKMKCAVKQENSEKLFFLKNCQRILKTENCFCSGIIVLMSIPGSVAAIVSVVCVLLVIYAIAKIEVAPDKNVAADTVSITERIISECVEKVRNADLDYLQKYGSVIGTIQAMDDAGKLFQWQKLDEDITEMASVIEFNTRLSAGEQKMWMVCQSTRFLHNLYIVISDDGRIFRISHVEKTMYATFEIEPNTLLPMMPMDEPSYRWVLKQCRKTLCRPYTNEELSKLISILESEKWTALVFDQTVVQDLDKAIEQVKHGDETLIGSTYCFKNYSVNNAGKGLYYVCPKGMPVYRVLIAAYACLETWYYLHADICADGSVIRLNIHTGKSGECDNEKDNAAFEQCWGTCGIYKDMSGEKDGMLCRFRDLAGNCGMKKRLPDETIREIVSLFCKEAKKYALGYLRVGLR